MQRSLDQFKSLGAWQFSGVISHLRGVLYYILVEHGSKTTDQLVGLSILSKNMVHAMNSYGRCAFVCLGLYKRCCSCFVGMRLLSM
jgi:hypothetical protein